MIESISIHRIENLFLGDPAFDDVWNGFETTTIKADWSGNQVEVARHFQVQMAWSDEFLFVRFEHQINETPVISSNPDTNKKTIGLWDRDVCEIFIALDSDSPERYFEFEIAPTGEWLDLAIEHKNGERLTDWDFNSGIKASALTDESNSVMTLQIPFSSLGKKPSKGDIWLGNIYRCVGSGESRGYLAWQPTLTNHPNFHVPEKFGKFVFT